MKITDIVSVREDSVYYTFTDDNVLQSVSSNLEPDVVKNAIIKSRLYSDQIDVMLEIAQRTGIIRTKSSQAVASFQAILDYEERKYVDGKRHQATTPTMLS